MSSGYYDKWRRGDERQAQPQVQQRNMVDGQVERLHYMEDRLQGCQSVIDRLVNRVGECETRTEASSRLAQLTQQVAEQSTEESGEVILELQARSRRQEEVIKKLIGEVDRMHATREADRDKTLLQKSSQHQTETSTAAKVDTLHRTLTEQMDDMRADFEHRLSVATQDSRAELKKTATQLSKGMTDLHSDMTMLKDFVKEEVKSVRQYCDAQVAAVTDAESVKKRVRSEEERDDFETFQSSVVSNVMSLQQHCRKLDMQLAEQATLLRTGSVGNIDTRLEGLDQRMVELDRLKADFGEHVTVFKGHLQKQTKRAGDTSTAIQQLIEMTDASRAAITTEVMGVKEWAMRCLQRLRKRTETALQDSRLARDEVVELSSRVTRSQNSNERHAAVMTELLSQQAEKTFMHDLVDKDHSHTHIHHTHGHAHSRSYKDDRPRRDDHRTRSASRSPSRELDWEVAESARAFHDHYSEAKSRAKHTQKAMAEERGDRERSSRTARKKDRTRNGSRSEREDRGDTERSNDES